MTDGNDLTVGAVTGATFNLALNAGTGDGSEIAGTSVSNAGTLTLTQADTATFSGTVSATTMTLTDTNDALTFQENVTATTLNTAALAYSVICRGQQPGHERRHLQQHRRRDAGQRWRRVPLQRRADEHGQHHNRQRDREPVATPSSSGR